MWKKYHVTICWGKFHFAQDCVVGLGVVPRWARTGTYERCG